MDKKLLEGVLSREHHNRQSMHRLTILYSQKTLNTLQKELKELEHKDSAKRQTPHQKLSNDSSLDIPLTSKPNPSSRHPSQHQPFLLKYPGDLISPKAPLKDVTSFNTRRNSVTTTPYHLPYLVGSITGTPETVQNEVRTPKNQFNRQHRKANMTTKVFKMDDTSEGGQRKIKAKKKRRIGFAKDEKDMM